MWLGQGRKNCWFYTICWDAGTGYHGHASPGRLVQLLLLVFVQSVRYFLCLCLVLTWTSGSMSRHPTAPTKKGTEQTYLFQLTNKTGIAAVLCCVGLLLAACQLFLLVLNLHVLQTLVSYGYKRAKQIEFSLAWLLVVAQLLYVPRDQLCPWLLSCVWYEHLDEGICIFVKLCDVRFVVCSVLWCDVCNDLCVYIMCNDDVLWCDV